MPDEVRCRKCNAAFTPNQYFYCGDSFCSSCIDEPLDDVVAAEKEAAEQYERMGHSKWKAKEKAYEFAQDVARERSKRGR